MARMSHEAEACRQLWVAVIVTAARDLLTPAADGLRAAQARAWIGTAQFCAVCELAGMNPSFVAVRLRAMEQRFRARCAGGGRQPAAPYRLEMAMREGA